MKLAKTKALLSTVVLAGFLMLFSGCPYTSSVPVDEGTINVPKYLIGQWLKSSDSDSENPTLYTVDKVDSKHAKLLKMEYSSSDESYDTTEYELTFSDVKGDVFMNAIEKEGYSYYIFRVKYSETSQTFTTEEVTDYITETFNSSEELKQFIAANKHLSFFFTSTPSDYVKK